MEITAYIKVLLHEVGRKVICALALMVALSLLEGIGLLLLLPMLDVRGLTAGPGQSRGITALVVSLLRRPSLLLLDEATSALASGDDSLKRHGTLGSAAGES